MSDATNAVETGTTDSSLTTTIQDDPNSIEQKPFDLAEPLDLRMSARGRRGKIPVQHVLRQPSLRDLMERDAAQPYRTQMVNDDIERPLADPNNNADANLYDKLVVSTSGYATNVTEGMSPEERKAALRSIPKAHKNNIISTILPVDTEYVPEPISDSDDAEVYQWGENLSYKFVSKFGVDGQYKVTVTMHEPSEQQLDEYRGATTFEIEKGGNRKPITRMTVDLKPAVMIFDALLESVEGFVVGGEPFDLKNPLHVKLINGYLKRSVLNALVKQTQLDLGN